MAKASMVGRSAQLPTGCNVCWVVYKRDRGYHEPNNIAEDNEEYRKMVFIARIWLINCEILLFSCGTVVLWCFG